MVKQGYQFYECDNPECRLRFPGYDGFPRWNRCPSCRSSIHQVATIDITPEEIHASNSIELGKVVAILDNIRSAWNVGSIFRTADGISIKKLYLCGITPTPANPKVCKTALGAEVSVAWEKVNNAFLLAKQLKSKGYQLWALEDTRHSQALFDIEIEKSESPTVLIVGNELSGIDPGVLEQCDKAIAIPMLGNKRSYNVAVAFGIAASFLLYRQNVSHGSRSTFPST
jgi:23S rRNA (guanosine2251-2'-O)-methyltransferase